MKFAADYRLDARNMLRNKWGIAILAGVIAGLLGAVTVSAPKINFNFNFDFNGFHAHHHWENGIGDLLGAINPLLPLLFAGGAVFFVITGIAYSLLMLGVGAIVGVGYASFNLHLNEEPVLNRMFSFFPHWRTVVASRLWRVLYITLWSFLLVIPGIIASFNYAMTDYILAENPEMPAREAIARSKEMMYGHRWRLFCLEFSFIGWFILSSLTFGIGMLWLIPYTQAAKASFYRDISQIKN